MVPSNTAWLLSYGEAVDVESFTLQIRERRVGDDTKPGWLLNDLSLSSGEHKTG